MVASVSPVGIRRSPSPLASLELIGACTALRAASTGKPRTAGRRNTPVRIDAAWCLIPPVTTNPSSSPSAATRAPRRLRRSDSCLGMLDLDPEHAHAVQTLQATNRAQASSPPSSSGSRMRASQSPIPHASRTRITPFSLELVGHPSSGRDEIHRQARPRCRADLIMALVLSPETCRSTITCLGW